MTDLELEDRGADAARPAPSAGTTSSSSPIDPAEQARTRTRKATIATAALLVQSAVELLYLHAFLFRPLAFDEQWRAYWVSLGSEFLPHIEEAPAPMTAGWLALQNASVGLLGNNELALRLPMVLALPALGVVTYFVARRFVDHLAGWAIAALVLLNGPLVVYGLLFKQFVFEAFFGILALAIWYWGHDRPPPRARTSPEPPARRRDRLPYALCLMALCTYFSVSALYVVLPLLGIEAWRCLRNRTRAQASSPVGLVLSLVLIGIHLQFWFLRQAKLVGDNYWGAFYMPHQPGPALELITSQLKSASKLLTAVYLPPDTTDQYLLGSSPPPFPSALVWLVALTFVGCLLWGAACAFRSERARPLLLVIVAAVVLQFGASWVQKWPFGLVRTNLVMVPILYIVAGIGATDVVRRAWAWLRPSPGAAEPVRPTAGVPVVVAGGVVALVLGVLVPVLAVTNVVQFRDRFSAPVFVDRIRDAVRIVRSGSGPDDIVIAALDNYGWAYYAWNYDDKELDDSGIARVPRERTLQVGDFTAPEIPGFVDAHPRAQHVYVFDFMGIGPEGYDQQARWMAERGRCPTRRWDFEQTGIVTEYTTSPDAPDRCGEPVRQPVQPLTG